jgi:hypothetical protein
MHSHRCRQTCKKRSIKAQVSMFLVLGAVVLIIMGIGLYSIRAYSANKANSNAKLAAETFEFDNLKVFAAQCLKDSSDEVFFEKIGLQGGFLDPSISQASLAPAPSFQGREIGIFAAGNSNHYPLISEIESDAETGIIFAFEECFLSNNFGKQGVIIEAGQSEVDVKINEKDISVSMKKKIKASANGREGNFEEFNAVLPIGFKNHYDSAKNLIVKARAAQSLPPNEYSLNPDCALYDKNGKTNVYLKPLPSPKEFIVQIVDFETFDNNYAKSFILQFAVKDMDLEGVCEG